MSLTLAPPGAVVRNANGDYRYATEFTVDKKDPHVPLLPVSSIGVLLSGKMTAIPCGADLSPYIYHPPEPRRSMTMNGPNSSHSYLSGSSTSVSLNLKKPRATFTLTSAKIGIKNDPPPAIKLPSQTIKNGNENEILLEGDELISDDLLITNDYRNENEIIFPGDLFGYESIFLNTSTYPFNSIVNNYFPTTLSNAILEANESTLDSNDQSPPSSPAKSVTAGNSPNSLVPQSSIIGILNTITLQSLFLIEKRYKRILQRNFLYSILLKLKNYVSIFNNISDKNLIQFSSLISLKCINSNSVIFKEGVASNAAYILYRGLVKENDTNATNDYYKTTSSQDSNALANVYGAVPPKQEAQNHNEVEESYRILGYGSLFGDVSLITGSPYFTTTSTMEPTVLISINKRALDKLFYNDKEKLTEIRIKLVGNKIELDYIMNHSLSNNLFLKFLEKEMASENISYINSVDKYNDMCNRLIKNFFNLYVSIKKKYFEIRKKLAYQLSNIEKKENDSPQTNNNSRNSSPSKNDDKSSRSINEKSLRSSNERSYRSSDKSTNSSKKYFAFTKKEKEVDPKATEPTIVEADLMGEVNAQSDPLWQSQSRDRVWSSCSVDEHDNFLNIKPEFKEVEPNSFTATATAIPVLSNTISKDSPSDSLVKSLDECDYDDDLKPKNIPLPTVNSPNKVNNNSLLHEKILSFGFEHLFYSTSNSSLTKANLSENSKSFGNSTNSLSSNNILASRNSSNVCDEILEEIDEDEPIIITDEIIRHFNITGLKFFGELDVEEGDPSNKKNLEPQPIVFKLKSTSKTTAYNSCIVFLSLCSQNYLNNLIQLLFKYEKNIYELKEISKNIMERFIFERSDEEINIPQKYRQLTEQYYNVINSNSETHLLKLFFHLINNENYNFSNGSIALTSNLTSNVLSNPNNPSVVAPKSNLQSDTEEELVEFYLIFNLARKEIFRLLHDPFLRFKQTPEFKQFIDNLKPYSNENNSENSSLITTNFKKNSLNSMSSMYSSSNFSVYISKRGGGSSHYNGSYHPSLGHSIGESNPIRDTQRRPATTRVIRLKQPSKLGNK